MYFYPEAAARLHCHGHALGARHHRHRLSTPYAADADEALAKGLAVRDAWREEALVSFLLAPHAPYSVNDETLERIATLAAQLDLLPVQIHLLETAQEREESHARHGETPLERLLLGLLGPGLVGVHAVHLTESEIALLARARRSPRLRPTSNMKLASGIAAVPQWLDAGARRRPGHRRGGEQQPARPAPGRFATRPCSPRSAKDAPVLPAIQALELATIGAARLGLEHRLGSIRPGKAADLIAVALDAVETQPCYDPCSHLVFVAGREHVSDVWVAGRRRVANGQLLCKKATAI